MIEKIIEKLTAKCRGWYEIWDANHDDEYADGKNEGFIEALDIVQEVVKEYGNADCISRSVLLDKLQKWKFANEERGYDTASDLVQEMIDLVKEQPSAPYQKGE